MTGKPPLTTPPAPKAGGSPFTLPPLPRTGPLAPMPAPPPPRPTSPFGPPRLGQRATTEIAALHDLHLRVDLRLCGRALYGLIDRPADEVAEGDLEPFFTLIEADRSHADALRARLDEQWAQFALKGALFVCGWSDGLIAVLKDQMKSGPQSPSFIPCTHALGALNLLGRTRGSLLLSRTPVVLERNFLQRNIAIADPRVMRLAVMMGLTTSSSLTEPKPDVFDDDDQTD